MRLLVEVISSPFLRKEIVQIAEKWHNDCVVLREHNLKHEQ